MLPLQESSAAHRVTSDAERLPVNLLRRPNVQKSIKETYNVNCILEEKDVLLDWITSHHNIPIDTFNRDEWQEVVSALDDAIRDIMWQSAKAVVGSHRISDVKGKPEDLVSKIHDTTSHTGGNKIF
jgi:hypothetical protein